MQFCFGLIHTNVDRDFWNSFWPNLWAGIVAGIITGLVVGFVILFAQKKSDKRRFARDSEVEWLGVMEDLPIALSKSHVANIGSLETLPSPVSAALEILKGKPLGIWLRELERYETDISLLIKLQNQRDRFISTAESLQLEISVQTREVNKDVWSGQDAPCIRFINGLVYGAPENEIMKWVGQPELTIERLREVASTVLAGEKVKNEIAQYNKFREAMLKTVNSLQKSLSKPSK